jgi:hypothetical protein
MGVIAGMGMGAWESGKDHGQVAILEACLMITFGAIVLVVILAVYVIDSYQSKQAATVEGFVKYLLYLAVLFAIFAGYSFVNEYFGAGLHPSDAPRPLKSGETGPYGL